MLKYLNPRFLYQRRSLIPLYAKNYASDAWRATRSFAHGLRVRLAERGLPLSVNDARMAKYKDKHFGRRAFVIGNGPSLRISDLERLRNEITFASNRIYVCFGETSWRPTYYLTSYLDKVCKDYYRDIAAFNGSVKFLPAAAQKRCMPIAGAIYYRRTHQWFFPSAPNFSINTIDTVYWGGTVTYELLQLACYMGIREIYLLGLDFSYCAPEIKGSEHGWYTSVRDVDHFHPDYLKPSEKAGKPLLHLHEKAYKKAREVMESLGGHIYNATRGGALEVFERVDLDRILDA